MRQSFRKSNKEDKKNISSSINDRISKKKKISFGKVVQKTVDILKKPFVNQKTNDKSKNQSKEKEAEKPTKNNRKKKPSKFLGGLVDKTKLYRKKETIVVDYPNPALKDAKKPKVGKISRKNSPKKNPLKKEIEKISSEFQDDCQFEDQEEKQKETASQISTEVNGFFYTNDKFITRFEDDDILEYLKNHYPLFMKNPSDFQTQKKQILEMLQNAQFIDELLSYYDMNIYEFFKFLFRLEPDLFRGSFLKRIQKAMRYKKYAIKAKRCSYAGRKKASLKKVRQDETFSGKSSTEKDDITWHWRK